MLSSIAAAASTATSVSQPVWVWEYCMRELTWRGQWSSAGTLEPATCVTAVVGVLVAKGCLQVPFLAPHDKHHQRNIHHGQYQQRPQNIEHERQPHIRHTKSRIH